MVVAFVARSREELSRQLPNFRAVPGTSDPNIAPGTTEQPDKQSDRWRLIGEQEMKLRFTRAANPPAGLQAGPGVWDADTLIALGWALRYK